MPLPLALVFHFNQHTHEYAHIADRACYRGLLNVLRAHPGLKFNLHFSGTLLRALNWLSPETLDLVRAGLADGQFELLGSTYAQNIPYASDDWDNAQQLALHRRVLAQLFGVRPKVFWNAERSWRQSLVPVIADGGYSATLVEDHLLQAAGLRDPLPARTEHAGRSLALFYDDTVLRERFNFAAWFGRRAQLFAYLERWARRPGSDRFLLAYAEDAEAMGLWPWQAGYLPQAAWTHLDALLRVLEQTEWIGLRHLSQVRARRTVGPLPDAAAQWMDRALLNPKAPYHEPGYDDWFDFLRHSAKLRHFTSLYALARKYLQIRPPAELRPSLDAGRTPVMPVGRAAAEIFYEQALEAFCHHQYEYGCIGVGGRGSRGWENVRAAFVYARVSELAVNHQPGLWIEDLNNDGSDEQLLSDGRYLAIFTGYGGRLLYWFDLLNGRQWVGNALAVPDAPYDQSAAARLPQYRSRPRLWLPESFTPGLRAWQKLRRLERAPTGLGRYLAEWLFQRGRTYPVYRRRTQLGGTRPPLAAQTGALVEAAAVDDEPEATAPDMLLDYRFEAAGPCYIRYLGPGLRLEKRIWLTTDGLAVRYSARNRRPTAHRLRLTATSELTPDYAGVVQHGRPALDFCRLEGAYPGVVNPLTQTAVVIRPSLPWTAQAKQVNLLALQISLTFELPLPPQSIQEFEIELQVRQV